MICDSGDVEKEIFEDCLQDQMLSQAGDELIARLYNGFWMLIVTSTEFCEQMKVIVSCVVMPRRKMIRR